MELSKVPEIQRQPVRDIIYETLKENIQRGDLKGGEYFTDKEIATVFNVSRMPVREAIQRLESEGYIERIHMKGSRVKGLSDRDVAHIYSMRKNLECLLFRYTAIRIAGAELAKLSDILEEVKASHASLPEQEFAAKCLLLFAEFNAVAFAASQFPQLVDSVKTLREQLNRFNLVQTLLLAKVKEGLKARQELVAAFRQKDPDLAGRIWSRHFDHTFSFWKQNLAGKAKKQGILDNTEYIPGMCLIEEEP